MQAYSIGLLETVTAMSGSVPASSSSRSCYSLDRSASRAYYFGFTKSGIPFSTLWLHYGDYNLDPDVLNRATNRAQSIYFFKLRPTSHLFMRIFY